MDLSTTLESYLVPAEEGFFSATVEKDNLQFLKERKPLVVFSKYYSVTMIKSHIKKIMKEYDFSSYLMINGTLFYNAELNDYSDDPEVNLILQKMTKRHMEAETSYGDGYQEILEKLTEISKERNQLILVYLSTFYTYSMKVFRNYPILMADPSVLRKLLFVVKDYSKIIPEDTRVFANSFTTKIPKGLFLKKIPPNFNLYHISDTKGIQTLTPRQTWKPMDNENMRIPRVSAASDIDSCFRAVSLPEFEGNMYVYKLQLTNQRIVKPDTKLVPDVGNTNEYWILDPVNVEPLGHVVMSHDPTTGETKFDDTYLKAK